MRIFLDANILFSAAKSDGAIRRLLRMLAEAGHECWVDAFVVEEANRNLLAKAIKGRAQLAALLADVRMAPTRARDAYLESTLPLPGKDQPVLAGAIVNGCEALVTGDKAHFGRLYGKKVQGVAIHSPRSLAEALLGGGVSKSVRQRRAKYQVRPASS